MLLLRQWYSLTRRPVSQLMGFSIVCPFCIFITSTVLVMYCIIEHHYYHSCCCYITTHVVGTCVVSLNVSRVTLQPYSVESSSRMRFMSHNWSATKRRLHPQSVDEISRHSVLSGNRIRQCETSLGLATRTQISVCKC